MRCRLSAAGGSAGTLARMTGVNPRVATPMINHQIFQEMSVALSSTAEMPTPKNSAMPWKAPHQPMAALTLSWGASARTMAGAVTVMRINPTPSMARVVMSQPVLRANPPATDATPARSIPSTKVFLEPMRSATTEATRPPRAPAIWTTPTSVPAATRLIPRSARINSRADGNFQTCIAARMPVATTTVHARVVDPVVDITTEPTPRIGKTTRISPSVLPRSRFKARCDHTSPREIRFCAQASQKYRPQAATVDVDVRFPVGLAGAQYCDGGHRGDPEPVAPIGYGRRSHTAADSGGDVRSDSGLTAGLIDQLALAASAQPCDSDSGLRRHWDALRFDCVDLRWRRADSAVDSADRVPGGDFDGAGAVVCQRVCARGGSGGRSRLNVALSHGIKPQPLA